MRADPTLPPRPNLRESAAWAVLLAGLLATGVAVRVVTASIEAEQRARFSELAAVLEGDVRARLEAYLALLRGTRGLFAEGHEPTPAEGAALVRSLELESHYPGIQGVGFSKLLRPDELAAHVARERAVGRAGYRVWPTDPRPVYTSVVWLEPLDWRNQRAIGYDMFSEARRRAAMERARDTGLPSATGKVVLVQEAGTERQPGVLVYLPVYRGQPRTVAERRERLVGWVYAPFRADDLLRAILGAGGAPRLDLEVYDGERVEPGAVLFDQDPRPIAEGAGGMTRVTRLEVAGRIWTVLFAAPGGVGPRSTQRLPAAVAMAGLAFSLLGFGVVRAQVRGRAAAEEAGRRQAELAAENAQLLAQAQEAVQARNEFISLASHELKTPLTALRLQAHALARNASGLAPEVLQARTEAIRRSTDRMARLVETLLDISRIAAGGLSLEPQDADLAQVVQDVAERFADEAQRSGCQLVVIAPPALVGRWDPLRLDHVVTNLIGNAVKYGPGQPVEVILEEVADRARLTVRDRGIGIAPADQQRIFERFERAVSGSSFGGFGLGLWIVRQTVEAHGGTIAVESEPGEGATFTVELPRSGPPAPAPRPA
ncbi:CHASE domain-containing protein [Anaeromyxobacter paludicola]|uniref:histidine kinase n=1 Tax=Anaeromyxobacter paludicola TaxID=2918171 RepID=A0ABN6NAL8_9BACT|nr:CHASE domain-containing protein [Anaeromyxobacter paludicola]BDG10292.1 hypothetical protein AMPC_34050 [Anaeromyxobacter paludicola]